MITLLSFLFKIIFIGILGIALALSAILLFPADALRTITNFNTDH